MDKKGYKEIFQNVFIKKEDEEKLRKIVAEWEGYGGYGEIINFDDIAPILESTGIKKNNNEVIIKKINSCSFEFYSETWGENGTLTFLWTEGTTEIYTSHRDVRDRYKIYFVGKRNGKVWTNELK